MTCAVLPFNKNDNHNDNDTNLPDDTLLILTNKLFLIHSFFSNNKFDDINDVKKLISQYKLYNN